MRHDDDFDAAGSSELDDAGLLDAGDSEYTEEEEFGADVELVRQPKLELGPDWEADTSLDVTEVRLEDPDLPVAGRAEPAWVIRSGYREEEIGLVKTGKEADVTLVRRTSRSGTCLLARKTYRPRAQRAFRREEDYREGQGFGDERVDRAVRARSTYGKSILEYAWAYRELPLMRTAWDAGARVPYPVEAAGEALYMQYLGDEERAAPRLAEVRLARDEAPRVFDELVSGMRSMLEAYLVHADLSAYNVLYWQGHPWIIDFPQAVDVVRSSRGLEFLRRDCANVCSYFRRQGVRHDPEELFQDLLRDAPFRTPMAHDARADLELAALARKRPREIPVRTGKRRR